MLTCSFSLFKVSLGVILKSENKVDEMIDIMDILHQYVPTKTTTEEFHLMSGEPFTVDIHRFHHLFLGGDQLTVARVRGAHRVRLNSNDGVGRLDGLVPSVEDWHAKVVYLEVSIVATCAAP